MAVAGVSVCLMGVIMVELGGWGLFIGFLLGIAGVFISLAGVAYEFAGAAFFRELNPFRP